MIYTAISRVWAILRINARIRTIQLINLPSPFQGVVAANVYVIRRTSVKSRAAAAGSVIQ